MVKIVMSVIYVAVALAAIVAAWFASHMGTQHKEGEDLDFESFVIVLVAVSALVIFVVFNAW